LQLLLICTNDGKDITIVNKTSLNFFLSPIKISPAMREL